jgi:type 1 fimbriae regulatory protein FimE
MKYLSKDELGLMLAQAKAAGPMDHLMILIAFNHGLRVSEVLNLTAENFVDGYLIVQRLKGSCKTAQKLLPNEAALLADYKIPECGRLFPIHRQTAWRHVKQFGVAAGIPGFKCFPHAIKHTTAMTALNGGMKINEIQTYLGHKSGASTMAYLKVSDEVACKAFAAVAGV